MLSKRFLVRGGVLAAAAFGIGAAVIAPPAPADAAPRGWRLPANAVEVGPDTYEIGTKRVGGRTLTGLAFVHRRYDAKPEGTPGGGSKGTTGYAYIAKGLKWKEFGESYVVDTSVEHWSGTYSASYIKGVIDDAVEQWEDATDGAIDGAVGVDVFGNGTTGTVDSSQIGESVNDVNEVCFAPIAESGVIAVTFVWGYYSGSPGSREIVEWDQIYDDDGSFTWGNADTGHTGMDFSNIATHEIGHSFGMGHPSGDASLETMYAYASNGEVIKRDLHDGDILGIDRLY